MHTKNVNDNVYVLMENRPSKDLRSMTIMIFLLRSKLSIGNMNIFHPFVISFIKTILQNLGIKENTNLPNMTLQIFDSCGKFR